MTNPVSRQRNSRVCPRRFWVLNLVATGTGASEAITTHSALILVEAPLPAFSSPFGALSGGAWSLLQCLFDQIGSQVAKRSTLLVAALFQCLKGAIRKGHGNSPGTSALVPQGGGAGPPLPVAYPMRHPSSGSLHYLFRIGSGAHSHHDDLICFMQCVSGDLACRASLFAVFVLFLHF